MILERAGRDKRALITGSLMEFGTEVASENAERAAKGRCRAIHSKSNYSALSASTLT